MCATCGCDEETEVKISLPGKENRHEHSHDHDSHKHHSHDHTHSREILLEQDVLLQNNLLAERNRGYFEAKNIFSVNLVSSPGSGKTTLLEQTAGLWDKNMVPIYVIEGDQQTLTDANRIDATGIPVVQVNTGHGCHLDADMIHSAVLKLAPCDNSVLIIENVGNLVCPALFDLGETHRVVMISVTEGEDKPLKYPDMFASSDVCLINKIDLLPYLDYDLEKAKEYALRVNSKLKFIEMSASKSENIEEWIQWLANHCFHEVS